MMARTFMPILIAWITVLQMPLSGFVLRSAIAAGGDTYRHLSPQSMFSSSWAGERYLKIPDGELEKELISGKNRLNSLQGRMEQLENDIFNAKKELQNLRTGKIDLELGWKLKMLQESKGDLVRQIAAAEEDIFLTEVKIELKNLFEQFVDSGVWRESILAASDVIQTALRGATADKTQNMLDFGKAKLQAQTKIIRAQLDDTEKKRQELENALRANLCVLEKDPNLLSQINRGRVDAFYRVQAEKKAFASKLRRWLDILWTKASPIGVDATFQFSEDYKRDWETFLGENAKRGITLEEGPAGNFEVRWEEFPDRTLNLTVVPAGQIPSLGRTDVDAGLIFLSKAAFVSPTLAVETLQQELDNFRSRQLDLLQALVQKILDALQRISNLEEPKLGDVVRILDPSNVNGIDTLGFYELVVHYQRDGVNRALLEKIIAYIEKAGSIYPIESLLARRTPIDEAL